MRAAGRTPSPGGVEVAAVHAAPAPKVATPLSVGGAAWAWSVPVEAVMSVFGRRRRCDGGPVNRSIRF